jgi:beta-1,4-N-acetylglucosaminyltransferase
MSPPVYVGRTTTVLDNDRSHWNVSIFALSTVFASRSTVTMDSTSSLLPVVLAVIATLAVVLLLRTWVVWKSIRSSGEEPRSRNTPLKTLVVLGSGGHTTELLHLLKNLDPQHYTPLIYIVATTDTTSLQRVTAFGGRQPDRIWKIPRSREVGQSYVTSVGTTLWSLLHAFWIVLSIRPGLLLCNGPGTCLPIAIVTLVFRILGLCEGKIVFVESFCRVTRYVCV